MNKEQKKIVENITKINPSPLWRTEIDALLALLKDSEELEALKIIYNNLKQELDRIKKINNGFIAGDIEKD